MPVHRTPAQLTHLFLLGAVAAGCGGGSAPATARHERAVAADTPGTLSPVQFIGRFDMSDPTAPRFGWPGSTIMARFSGTSLQVTLDDGTDNQFDVSIDGVLQPILLVTGPATTYTLASGLAPGEHTVVLTRRTESLWGVTTFLGFPGATLIPTRRPFNRHIEFIGDSNTAGYGVLGTDPCPFTADTESEPSSWAGITAQRLGVAHTTIAFSGAGVYQNNPDVPGPPMPVIYGRTLRDDPTSVWDYRFSPDVVVSNLGVNDYQGADPGQPFTDAYDAFVRQLRSHYPQAYIILAISPLQGFDDRMTVTQHMQDAVNAAAARGDNNVTVLDVGQVDPAVDGEGCDHHPNLIVQRRMADMLIAHLHARLGW